ncbi:nuclear receptor subfamily 0 group B member 1-like [Genypterus blacodes]|uniref:nuclear receptor subfamily 0 group B member 1-like n=1 Tax=Genypterus blacodes TaxID=154954 RepID=UPI003F7757A5
MACCDRCEGAEERGRGSILYRILNDSAPCPRGVSEAAAAQRLCSCASDTQLVATRAPRLVFKAASEVLLKTFRFVKNVPCFRGLPAEDQRRLVRGSWAPLLLLGLAQDSVDLDTVETRRPSLLHRILTRSKERQQQRADEQDPGVPLGDAQGIRTLLGTCRKLSISVREHALLKGVILFDPEVTELQCREYVMALHREAQLALCAHVRTAHRGCAHRLGQLRAAVHALRCVNADAVGRLLFRPVTGTRSADELVLTLFYQR